MFCVSKVKLDGGVDGGGVEGCYDRENRVSNKKERGEISNTNHLSSLSRTRGCLRDVLTYPPGPWPVGAADPTPTS